MILPWYMRARVMDKAAGDGGAGAGAGGAGSGGAGDGDGKGGAGAGDGDGSGGAGDGDGKGGAGAGDGDGKLDNLLGGDGAGDGTGDSKGGTGDGDGKLDNLLGGDGAGDGTGDGAKTEPTEAEVAKFLEGITAVDLGKDAKGEVIPWDDAALKAVAPVMLREGIGAAQADAIVGAYAAHVKAQYAESVKAQYAWNRKLVDECKTKFGSDLPTFVKEARAGGLHVFGRELWGEISAVTNFTNDARVIEALAKIGRTVMQDGGVSGDGQQSEGDFAARYMRSSL